MAMLTRGWGVLSCALLLVGASAAGCGGDDDGGSGDAGPGSSMDAAGGGTDGAAGGDDGGMSGGDDAGASMGTMDCNTGMEGQPCTMPSNCTWGLPCTTGECSCNMDATWTCTFTDMCVPGPGCPAPAVTICGNPCTGAEKGCVCTCAGDGTPSPCECQRDVFECASTCE